jgi:hypothetical protein
VLAPGEPVVLVRDPAAFGLLYPNVQPAGTYDQQLSNGGERLALRDPLGRALPAVEYDDDAPWPEAADGGGWSLQWRPELGPAANGSSWMAAVPTPGTAWEPPGSDRDKDGLPDRWEEEWGTNPDQPDADADPDVDGSSNAAERAAGTDPREGSDRLQVLMEGTEPGETALIVRFEGRAGRIYRVESSPALGSPAWSRLVDLPASGIRQDHLIEVPWTNIGTRFFRVRVLDFPR